MKAVFECETLGSTVIFRRVDGEQSLTVGAGNAKTACAGLREYVVAQMGKDAEETAA